MVRPFLMLFAALVCLPIAQAQDEDPIAKLKKIHEAGKYVQEYQRAVEKAKLAHDKEVEKAKGVLVEGLKAAKKEAQDRDLQDAAEIEKSITALRAKPVVNQPAPRPALRLGSVWEGKGRHMRGPSVGKGEEALTLAIIEATGNKMKAIYRWENAYNGPRAVGYQELEITIKGTDFNAQADGGWVGRGTLKDDILDYTWTNAAAGIGGQVRLKLKKEK
jgi:hypothetical protein